MSLRTRLIAGLLALAAIGLVLLAGVTYAEQRHFLISRVDDQARDAAGWVKAGGPRPLGGYGARPGFDPDGDGDRGGGGPGGPAAGTWLIVRSSEGDTPRCLGCYEGSTATAPTLPKDVPVGEATTVEATNSGDSYRVYGVALADGTARYAALPLEDTEATLHRLVKIEGLVIMGILLALGALAWWLVAIGLRPLERIGRTAGSIAAGDLSRRVDPATPRTEVGRLGLALNKMLERLEEAFSKQRASEERLRTFLADASHELRTPLASIRGYAELFRIGAAREPEDTEKAMSRIEAEAARMGVLVEDLLTLARLDEVRELIRERVRSQRIPIGRTHM